LIPFKARMEERRNAYRALVRKPLGKRPLGIRMDGAILKLTSNQHGRKRTGPFWVIKLRVMVIS